jgi:hypothetical protein
MVGGVSLLKGTMPRLWCMNLVEYVEFARGDRAVIPLYIVTRAPSAEFTSQSNGPGYAAALFGAG